MLVELFYISHPMNDTKVGDKRTEITVVRKTKSGKILRGLTKFPESLKADATEYAKATLVDDFVDKVWLVTEAIEVTTVEEIK